MPNTFTAIALDLTDNTSPYGSVHIRDKTTVGERLAAAGIKAAYGGTAGYVQGPTVRSAAFDKQQGVLKVTFSNTGAQGLDVKAAGPNDVAFEWCSKNCTMTGAAGDGWLPAKVSAFDQSTVTLAHAGLGARARGAVHGDGPVLVRYAWAAVPFQYKAAVLYGGDSKDEMLPAGGFVIPAE